MKPRLIGIAGPAAGDRVDLGADPVALDGDGLLALDARRGQPVAEAQVTVRPDGDGFSLHDRGSCDGTLVNGTQVTTVRLATGDQVTIGASLYVFVTDEEATADLSEVTIEMTAGPLAPPTTVELLPRDALYLEPERVRVARRENDRVAADLSTLVRISTLLASIREPETVKLRILELTAEVVPAERAGILLLAGDRDRERSEKSDEPDADAPVFGSVLAWTRPGRAPGTVRFSKTIARQVVRERVAVLANGVLDALPGSESLTEAHIRSVLCVPLLLFERLLGVLYLDSSAPAARFDERHLELVTAIAATAAPAFDRARHAEHIEAENQRLLGESALRHGMLGKSERMQDVFRQIARMAPHDSTVLLGGESGTGKELAARALHQQSPRAAGPFVAVNCAAIPEGLLESELFGHEPGAFTGAARRLKEGKLELAHGGTLLLDEVGELPLVLQAKLLRALQERCFERVGGTRPVRVDLRLIAATNRDLEAAVRAGTFRQDLFYRLNVLALTLPPLRERREDIPLLARHFAARLGGRLRRTSPEISREAASVLLRHDWPGNVRELENAIERAIVLGPGDVIRPEDLPEGLLEAAAPAAGGVHLGRYHDAVNDAKRQVLARALKDSRGNAAEAARSLGLNPTYLHRLLTKLNLRTREPESSGSR